jgi:spore maturation protein SpmB
MIPIILGVKLFKELGMIAYIAMPLSPVMALMGLPGEMGLVWATAMINNIYGGMIVFVSLSAHASLTTAQVTVLGTMILIAHSLPIEIEIARKSGTRFLFQCIMRIGSAMLVGVLLHHIYKLSGWLQTPSQLVWTPETEPENLIMWGLDQLQNLGLIFAIISG